jgi:hypothetical protein
MFVIICARGFDEVVAVRQHRDRFGSCTWRPQNSPTAGPALIRIPLACLPWRTLSDPDSPCRSAGQTLTIVFVPVESSASPFPSPLDCALNKHLAITFLEFPPPCMCSVAVDNPTRWERANWANLFEVNALPMFCRCGANAVPKWKCQGTEPPGSAMGALPGLPHWLCHSPSLLSAQPARPITEGLLSSAATHAPPWATPAPPCDPLSDRNAACASGRIMSCLTSSAWALDS